MSAEPPKLEVRGLGKRFGDLDIAEEAAAATDPEEALAGTVRYRVPWDFLLALLAAFALERAWELVRERRRPPVSSAAR